MSMQHDWAGPIPEETERVARAAFPKGSVAMQMRDLFGAFVSDRDLELAYLMRGRSVETPWRLALVTVLQFMEGLSDRQAADAVRGRIDWKYALGLELTDAGFDYSVLSEFRDRLVAEEVDRGYEGLFLARLLDQARARGWLKARGRQRTDSTHVLAAIRTLNRLMLVAETVRAALNSLAVAAPEWLQGQVGPDWHDRYDQRVEEYRLPTAKTERAALAATIGADGRSVLQAVYAPEAPPWLRALPAVQTLRALPAVQTLRALPAVQTLRAVWVQQYYAPDAAGVVRWREEGDWPPAAQLIQSPYDTQARYSTKRDTHWTGYKVHLTETCDPDTPRLITHVETTPATTADSTMLGRIHQELAGKNLLPAEHLVDAGYTDAEHLVTSRQDYGVDVVGPVPINQNWQARAGQGFDVSCFAIDWEARTATCPAGCTSVKWLPTRDRHGQDIINIEFRQADCRACAHRPHCTHAVTEPRGITVRPQAAHEALQAARQRQTTAAFKEQYAARAGIEGTISQGTRAFGFRRARYIGLAKTHLQHVLTAVAIDVTRMVAWADESPFAATRSS